MTDDLTEADRWHKRSTDVAWVFAKEVAELAKSNPSELPSVLNSVVNNLMTELWDFNFSQTEIRTAFEQAIKDMPRYTGGQERRV